MQFQKKLSRRVLSLAAALVTGISSVGIGSFSGSVLLASAEEDTSTHEPATIQGTPTVSETARNAMQPYISLPLKQLTNMTLTMTARKRLFTKSAMQVSFTGLQDL